MSDKSAIRAVIRMDVWLFAASIAVFLAWPEADLRVSDFFFFDGFLDGGFPLRASDGVIAMYWVFSWLHWPVLIALLVALLIGRWRDRTGFAHRPGATVRRSTFLLAFLILAPGIVVNELVKKNSGRPRPDDTAQFGGEATYVAPFDFRGGCPTNCSFVSGHAAFGFWFIGLGWALVSRTLFVGGMLIGIGVGLGRIVQGAHYLSDVVFAFWIVYWIGLVLSYVFGVRDSARVK